MIIEIDSIKNSGNLEKERVIFKVIENGDLGKYMVAQSITINDTSFSSKLQNLYWFPDKELKAGDLVVLYTKQGEKGNSVNEDGSTTYFYYWGLTSTLSSIEKSCVVLLETSWSTQAVPKPELQSEIDGESK